ncbi:MAG: extracellular solute-binding protein [Chloroflexi bacterium]|nr:extracellular solute-binding protein [Chloroflexota bacterium]
MNGAWRLTLAIIILLGLVLGACAPTQTEPPVVKPNAVTGAETSGKQGWENEWDRVVAAARKEGRLSFYVQWGPSVLQALSKGFKARYGIDIEFTTAGKGAELAAKILAERRAGLYLADVFGFGATTTLGQLKPAGAVTPMEPFLILPETKDPNLWMGGNFFMDKGRTVAAVAAEYNSYVTRNTDFVKEGEIKSYSDLLDPKWKGRIVLSDPTVAGTGNSWVALIAEVWGTDKAKDFLRQLVKQEPMITRDLRLGAEWLAKGKYAVGIALHLPEIKEFNSHGAPVEIVRVKEGGSITAGSGCLSVPEGKLPHPNASKVFVNWFLTKEGQTLFSQSIFRPSVRKDVTLEGLEDVAAKPGDAFVKETEESVEVKTMLMGVAREILAPAMR